MAQWTTNFPLNTDLPSQSQPLFLGNNQYLINTATPTTGLLRDHQMTQNTSNANDGIHKQVTLANLGSMPSLTGANCAVYAAVDTKSTPELWFLNSGTPCQLTSNITVGGVTAPSYTAPKGVTFLPGGLLLQYGNSNSASGVVFPIPFTTVYSITFGITSNFTTLKLLPYVGGISVNGFTVVNNTGDNFAYYWMAIGLA